jgi:MFS family permease
MRPPDPGSALRPRTHPHRWGVLAASVFAQAAAAAVLQGMPGLAQLIRTQYALGYHELGLLLSGGLIGLLLTSVAWGLAIDRVGERRCMSAGLTLCGGAMIGAATAGSAPALTGWLVAAGAAGAAANAASGRLVITWFPEHNRGTAMGVRQTAIPAGAGISTFALPLVGEAAGVAAALTVVAVACLAAAAVVALVVRDTPPSPAAGSGSVTAADRPAPDRPAPDLPADGPARPGTARTVALVSAVSALLVVPQLAIVSFLVVYLDEAHGVPAVTAAFALAAVQFLGGAARIAVGFWSDRWGRRVAPLLGTAALVAVLFATIAVAEATASVAAGPLLVGAGVAAVCWNGLAFTIVGEQADPRRVGLALAVQNTAVAAGMAVTPTAFGALLGATSWAWSFAAVATVTAMACALLLRPARTEARYERGSSTSRLAAGLDTAPPSGRSVP